MAKSTQVVTDLTSATTTAFGATASAAAIAAAGPNMDLVGMANLALLKAEELKVLLQRMCDASGTGMGTSPVQAGDPNYTVLHQVLEVLV